MLHRLVFWLLIPVTVPQGLWLRRRATRLPGAEGKRTGRCGSGSKVRLLAIGDSIIDGVGTGAVERSLPVQFASELARRQGCCVEWRVEGTSGHGIADVVRRIGGLPPDVCADVVLISVGVNDVTGLTPTHRWRRSLQQLFAEIKAHWPTARTLFAGLPPMGRFPLPPQPLSLSLGLRAATLDRVAREVIELTPDVLHVPTRINPSVHEFCPDGFHPSADSCTLWARELAALLAESAGAGHDRLAAGKP